jgi:hypothetical protein
MKSREPRLRSYVLDESVRIPGEERVFSLLRDKAVVM